MVGVSIFIIFFRLQSNEEERDGDGIVTRICMGVPGRVLVCSFCPVGRAREEASGEGQTKHEVSW